MGGVRCLGLFPKKINFFWMPSLKVTACSLTDWPNVSHFDGNGNGDGDSDGRYFGLYPFSRKKRLLQTFTFYKRTFTFYRQEFTTLFIS